MDELKIFENPAFGEIRALTIEGEPWFVGKDVTTALGYLNASKALSDHVDAEDKLNNESLSSLGQRGGWLINESGLYSLILSSKLESAKAFKRWITSEVLPAIRKTGGYIAASADMTDAEIMAKAVLVANRTIEARNARIAALEAKIEADAPKVLYADAVAEAEGGMLVREFAKFLKQNGVDTGEKRLYADLRRRGLIIKAEGRDKNKPTQYAMERGWFTVKEVAINAPMGLTITKTTTLITGKGRQYLLNMYLSEQEQTALPVGAET